MSSSLIRVANARLVCLITVGQLGCGNATKAKGFCKAKRKAFDTASVAQLVEQGTENPRVIGSIPIGGTICGFSSSGRAPPCQGGGSEFEPRNPLQRTSGAIFGAIAKR